MTTIWKPTKQEKQLIKDCAVAECGYKTIRLEVGERYNLDDGFAAKESINIALVGRESDWSDTDLLSPLPWGTFCKGVPLTEDGRAVVDFYCYRTVDGDQQLVSNVWVTYENGVIKSVEGVGKGFIHKNVNSY